MTIDDIKNMDSNILVAEEIADLLSCRQTIIRDQAQLDCHHFNFPVSVMASRVKIPRLAFISWYERYINEETPSIKYKGNDVCAYCGKKQKDNVLLLYHRPINAYLCAEHFLEQCCKREKDTRESIRKETRNVYEIKGKYAEVKVYDTKGNYSDTFIIDEEDVERCKKHRWMIKPAKNNYKVVVTDTGKEKYSLHRYIIGNNGDKQIDHINRNPLDNRKSNLRFVEPVENMANNGGQNVQLYPNGKYKCYFIRYGVGFYLGYFNTKEEAQEAKKNKLEEIEKNKDYYLHRFNEIKKNLPKGVSLTQSGRYRAGCVIRSKNYRVGTFDTPEEATKAIE